MASRPRDYPSGSSIETCKGESRARNSVPSGRHAIACPTFSLGREDEPRRSERPLAPPPDDRVAEAGTRDSPPCPGPTLVIRQHSSSERLSPSNPRDRRSVSDRAGQPAQPSTIAMPVSGGPHFLLLGVFLVVDFLAGVVASFLIWAWAAWVAATGLATGFGAVYPSLRIFMKLTRSASWEAERPRFPTWA